MPLLVNDFTICNTTHGFEILTLKHSPFESPLNPIMFSVSFLVAQRLAKPSEHPQVYLAVNAQENLSLYGGVIDESHLQGF